MALGNLVPPRALPLLSLESAHPGLRTRPASTLGKQMVVSLTAWEPFTLAKLTGGGEYRSMGRGAGGAESPSCGGGALQVSSLWRTRAFTPIQSSVDNEE